MDPSIPNGDLSWIGILQSDDEHSQWGLEAETAVVKGELMRFGTLNEDYFCTST